MTFHHPIEPINFEFRWLNMIQHWDDWDPHLENETLALCSIKLNPVLPRTLKQKNPISKAFLPLLRHHQWNNTRSMNSIIEWKAPVAVAATKLNHPLIQLWLWPQLFACWRSCCPRMEIETALCQAIYTWIITRNWLLLTRWDLWQWSFLKIDDSLLERTF